MPTTIDLLYRSPKKPRTSRRRPLIDVHLDFAIHDPFRPTDWRWRLAGEVASNSRLPDCSDEALLDAIWLQRALTGPQTRGRRKQPSEAVLAAHAIYRAQGALKTEIEARLLAGQSLDQISEHTSVAVATLDRFEAVFFSVVDRLTARDYVATMLRRGSRAADGRLDVATVVKTVAFRSGIATLEILLQEVLDDTGNLKPFDGFDWTTQSGRDCAKLRLLCAVIQLPETIDTALELALCHKAILDADNSTVHGAADRGAINQAADQAYIEVLRAMANAESAGADQSAMFNVRAG